MGGRYDARIGKAADIRTAVRVAAAFAGLYSVAELANAIGREIRDAELNERKLNLRLTGRNDENNGGRVFSQFSRYELDEIAHVTGVPAEPLREGDLAGMFPRDGETGAGVDPLVLEEASRLAEAGADQLGRLRDLLRRTARPAGREDAADRLNFDESETPRSSGRRAEDRPARRASRGRRAAEGSGGVPPPTEPV